LLSQTVEGGYHFGSALIRVDLHSLLYEHVS
jgi:hypothetical protein